MLTFIDYLALFLAVIATALAIKGYHRMYWIAAVCIYIFSVIAGFSIGQVTVGFTFVLMILALGYSIGWIKSRWQHAFSAIIGVCIGAFMVFFVDDYWLFYPLSFFG